MLGLTTSCGGPAQDEEQAPVVRKPASTLCARCKALATIAVRVTAWCNDCFHRGFSARFGKAMEPARTVSSEGTEVFEGRKPERRRNDPSPAKPPGKLVLAFSGGPSSRALLELVKAAYFAHLHPSPATTDESSMAPASTPSSAIPDAPSATVDGEDVKKKKVKKHGLARPPVFSECEVVFVDESSVPGYGDDRTGEVRRIVEETAPYFRFTALKLEDIFSLSSDSPILRTSFASTALPSTSLSGTDSAPSEPSPSARDRLLSLLSPSLLSPTARASLQTALLSTLIRSHARSSGAETLLLGTSATRISILTLAGMAEGRSWAAGEEVAAHYVDRSGGADKPLLVVRPLALTLAKEVAYYSRTVSNGGLQSLVMRDPSTSVSEKGSEKAPPVELKKKGIGALVEEFILSLEDDFPATVSTVVRTTHKLGLRSADAAARAFANGAEEEVAGCNCVVCGLPAQPDAHAWRAAITISDLEEAKRALAASGSAAVPSSVPSASSPSVTASPTPSTTPVKRLEPYQPSAAHLLPESSATADFSPSTVFSDSALPAALPSCAPQSVSPEATDKLDTADGSSMPLTPFLCYACLLIFQEPTAASLKPSARSSTPASVDLPPYVAQAVEARLAAQRRAGQEKGEVEVLDGVEGAAAAANVVGTKEVKGREALREEVKDFLLEEDE